MEKCRISETEKGIYNIYVYNKKSRLIAGFLNVENSKPDEDCRPCGTYKTQYNNIIKLYYDCITEHHIMEWL